MIALAAHLGGFWGEAAGQTGPPILTPIDLAAPMGDVAPPPADDFRPPTTRVLATPTRSPGDTPVMSVSPLPAATAVELGGSAAEERSPTPFPGILSAREPGSRPLVEPATNETNGLPWLLLGIVGSVGVVAGVLAWKRRT